MPVPEDNPITIEKIELGRRLFDDRRLSRDGTIACTSCHDPARAFSAPAAITPGVFGRLGTRNAAALINRGWGRAFFWDGRAATLEEQVLQPIDDPNEISGRGRGRSSRQPFTSRDRTRAGDLPPIDHVRQLALRPVRERRPRRTLSGGRGRAAHLSREGQLHRLPCRAELVGRTVSQHRHRLGNSGGLRWRVHGRRTRRNHRQGRGSPLEHVVDYYDRGGNRNAWLDPELRPLGLSDAEKTALVAFLQSLSAPSGPAPR